MPWQAQYFDVQYSTNSNVLGPNVRSELVAPILGDVERVAQIDRRKPFREASLSTVPYISYSPQLGDLPHEVEVVLLGSCKHVYSYVY